MSEKGTVSAISHKYEELSLAVQEENQREREYVHRFCVIHLSILPLLLTR
jgi:hypothetical protein